MSERHEWISLGQWTLVTTDDDGHIVIEHYGDDEYAHLAIEAGPEGTAALDQLIRALVLARKQR